MSNVCFYLRRTRVFSQLNRHVWDGYSNLVSSFDAQKKSAFLAPHVLPSAQISFSGTICLGMYSLPSSSPFPLRAQTRNKALPGWLAVSWDGHPGTAGNELLKLWTADEVERSRRLDWMWALNPEGEGCVYLCREKLKREIILLFQLAPQNSLNLEEPWIP